MAVSNTDLSEAFGDKKRASNFDAVSSQPRGNSRRKLPMSSSPNMSLADVAKALLGEDATADDPEKPPLGQENEKFDKAGNPKTVARLQADQQDLLKRARESDALAAKTNADKAKAAAADPKKPLWSQREEARYRDAEKFGGIPSNKIYAQPANVPGDPTKIPAGMEDKFRTSNPTDRNPKTGLTDDAVWKNLFTPKGPQQDGVLPEKRDPTAQAPRPADAVFDKHFDGQWADADPAQRAALLRSEVGPAGTNGWVTPADTAKEVGAGTDASGNRTVSGPYGGGFATNVPATSPMLTMLTMPPLPEKWQPEAVMPGTLPIS